jgi:hypothetical protein
MLSIYSIGFMPQEHVMSGKASSASASKGKVAEAD